MSTFMQCSFKKIQEDNFVLFIFQRPLMKVHILTSIKVSRSMKVIDIIMQNWNGLIKVFGYSAAYAAIWHWYH